MKNIMFHSAGVMPEITFTECGSFEGASLCRLHLHYPEKAVPEPVVIAWQENNCDAFSVFTPLNCVNRMAYPSWIRQVSADSSANSGMPLYQHLNKAGENICTAALQDCVTPCSIRGGIEERSGLLQFELELFVSKVAALQDYETVLLIDRERQPHYRTLARARRFWDAAGLRSAHVPEAARHRVFSSWYCFQKDVNEENLYRQCVLAREYGMDTVILDDGWQTPRTGADRENVYHDMGDWKPSPEKFPDLRRFAGRLHAIGMKLILWVALPFIGEDCADFGLFRDKLLCGRDSQGACVLDPRHPEVRNWIVRKLSDLHEGLDVDGFKLDFVDAMRAGLASGDVKPGMDIPDLMTAVQTLMREIHRTLTERDPEILIEFRQAYMGPEMQGCCNMMRVGDRAYGAMYNRVNGIDLRLLSGGTPIHSDMLMWDYDATPEAAADQLTNLLFIVPQVSMFLDRLPESHRKMLHFYLDFIDRNKDILQGGELIPLGQEALYSAVSAVRDGQVIAALYSTASFRVPAGTEKLTAVNATGDGRILIDFLDVAEGAGKAVAWKHVIRNCMGEILESGETDGGTVAAFDVPHNGMLEMVRLFI